jgi:hypothetical protein
MRRVLVSLLLFSLLACDLTDDRSYANFDARLREMAGANERQLLGSMGRIPDNSYQLADQTKVLQWRWDTSYDSPACTSAYRGRRSIGVYPMSPVRENCVVEWTVSKGTSQTYHWQGVGCRSVTLVSMPPP